MDASTLAAAKAYANNRLNWRGAWAATTSYSKNDLVTYNGGLYRAPTAFTSGASFVKANWLELMPQINTYAPYELVDSAASIEEYTTSLFLGWFCSGADKMGYKGTATGLSIPLGPIRHPGIITSCSLAGPTVATDVTNYWAFRLRRFRSSDAYGPPSGTMNASDIVISGTLPRANGGLGMTSMMPWDFSFTAWDFSAAQVGPGDVLGLFIEPHGAPPDLDRLSVTWAWRPLP